MMGHFSLLPNDDNIHSLLEPPSPAYTNLTIRRAFIVWLHTGQKNEFRQVCNYFHRLETVEETLSVEERGASRFLEFKLLTNYPPISSFLSLHFPKLYRPNKNSKINIKEVQEVTLEDCVFNLQGYYQMMIKKNVSTKDIIKTSEMIKLYCKTHYKSLKTLLAEFQAFAKKAEAANSVNNIAMYVKKKFLEDELVLLNNMSKTFSFLDVEDAETVSSSGVNTKLSEDNKDPCLTMDHTKNANKNANKIKILINESRRKELFSVIPICEEVTKSLTEKQKEKPACAYYELVHKL